VYMQTFMLISVILLFVSQAIHLAWLLFLHFRSEDLSPKIKVFSDSQMADIQGRMAVLEQTWTDVYAKLHRVVGRINKVGALADNPPHQESPRTEAEMKAEIMRKARFGS